MLKRKHYGWCHLSLFLFVGFGMKLGTALGNEPLPEAKLKLRVELKSNQLADLVVENQENEHINVDVSVMRRFQGLIPEADITADSLMAVVDPGRPFHPIIPIHPITPIHPIIPIHPILPVHPLPIHLLKPIHLVVPSHQEVRSQFEFEAPKEGPMVVHFQSKVTLPNGQVKNGPIFYQVYQNTPRGLQAVTFEEAFLSRRMEVLKQGQSAREAQLNLGGGFTAPVAMANLAFKDHALDISTQKIIPVALGSPLEMANKLGLKILPELGGRSRTAVAANFPILPGVTLDETPSSVVIPNDSSTLEGFSLERAEDTESNLNVMSSLTIKGHMSTKYNDGSFHAAWGWVVTVWQYDKIAGLNLYMPLGWTYVNGDGSWSIPLASFATTQSQVFVQYQTANRFVQVQDPAGHPYTWGDWWSLTGGVTDIGYRFADLSSNGDLPGIDKLYEGATEVWSKFYVNGMNALRDQPIQVTYPNSLTSGHCIMNKDGSGNTVPAYAWSCSEWANGKIWIIPAHGDKSVVQHEVAHSINSYYWNGNLSSGSGGAHSLTGCYNGGLALTEGFADFLTYWVQFDRGNSNPVASYFNINIESYNGDSCSSGEINEMRVASTFWDMYDVPNDGSDTNHYDGWYYTNSASSVSLYLKNGTKQKMSDYLSLVDAGDASWFTADRALFRLNHIIP